MTNKPQTILQIDPLGRGWARLTLVYECLPDQASCRATGERAELALAAWCGDAFAGWVEFDNPPLAAAIRSITKRIPLEPESPGGDAN